jgi:hypothetical protein
MVIPGEAISMSEVKVIGISSKRITADNMLHIFILRIREEMAILQKHGWIKKCLDRTI